MALCKISNFTTSNIHVYIGNTIFTYFLLRKTVTLFASGVQCLNCEAERSAAATELFSTFAAAGGRSALAQTGKEVDYEKRR